MSSDRHLAQFNIARLRYEIGDPRVADFADNLALVNGLADRSPGFIWRYQDADGSATNTRPYEGDPRMITNLSVWESVEALEQFVWRTLHKRFYGRRAEWFEHPEGPYLVMWWVPVGYRPTVAEGVERLEHLKRNGPSEAAFGWEGQPSAQLWRTARCA